MGEERIGSSSIGKSVRSLLDALASLEKEIEVVFERAGGGKSVDSIFEAIARLMSGPGFEFGSVFRLLDAAPDRASIGRGIGGVLGLADERSVDEIRRQVSELGEQVARLREREVALAGGLSQLRARSARFDEALAGLARVQGRCAARLGAHADKAEQVEILAGRRDDHITRLIRDTAAQRAELERVSRTVDENVSNAAAERLSAVADAGSSESARSEQFAKLEKQLLELKKTHKNGAEGTIETLELVRDRLGRLESRAAEMSREARAKTGRLDALARHVSTVEGRLATAIGKRDDSVVPVGSSMDSMDTPEESVPPVGPS
jgi:chromosome segregation ATPase